MCECVHACTCAGKKKNLRRKEIGRHWLKGLVLILDACSRIRMPGWSSNYSFVIHLPANVSSGGQQMMAQGVWVLHPYGRPTFSCEHLPLAWSRPGCYSHCEVNQQRKGTVHLSSRKNEDKSKQFQREKERT